MIRAPGFIVPLALSVGLGTQTGCQSPRHARRCSTRVDVERIKALCATLSADAPVQPGSVESSLMEAIGGNTWRSEWGQGGIFCGEYLLSWFRPADDEPCIGRSRPDCYRIDVHEFPVPTGFLETWGVDQWWRVELEGWQDDQGLCRPAARGDLFPIDFVDTNTGVGVLPGLEHLGPDAVEPITLKDYIETF